MHSLLTRRLIWRLLAVIALAAGAVAAAPARAATDTAYISATGHYVRGAFRDFWDKNGGLANFGYPLTEEYVDPQTGRIYQYFERARFERASATAATVELGLLGRDAAGDRVFATAQPVASTKQRRYFAETKHVVQYGFKETWESRGGLKIFGYPLSDELDEQLADGQTHTVQYFERARFEYWPDRPAGQRVLLALLGRQFAPKDLTPPLAPGAPPAGPITVKPAAPSAPGLVRPLLPPSTNARVLPQAGLPGSTFTLAAQGFQAGEKVGVWVNAPDGAIYGASFQATADTAGSISGAAIGFPTDAKTPLGVWSFVAQGVDSKRVAVGYFLVIGDAIGRLPPAKPPVPANTDARAEPGAGPAGTIFFFDASGFKPGEEVAPTIVASDGTKVTVGYTVKADDKGAIGYAGLYYVTEPTSPLGLWRFEAKGKDSGKLSVAYFVLTP
ncbi:hypothetical protein [Kouleothrix sp.]|uniref:hypothetical protein n=1 Tax=Kouleothrix sp. TaxID=2779161 RepID=UPI00391CD782